MFRRELAKWFLKNRRSFPWRTRRTPYRVWVSEAMLQQTRAEQALPYYRRFMRRFPTVQALARASRRDVLKSWEGMGYYARARHLHDAARFIVTRRRGRWPATFEEWIALPGVGRYTAAAVASLAMGLDRAVVDGNVIRVLSRFMALRSPTDSTVARRQIAKWAQSLLIPGKAGLSNEALMELGALCCVPRNPKCPECPLKKNCRAFSEGCPESFPVKRRKKAIPHKIVGAGVVVNRKGEVLIAQRKETSMLGGLWEFPGGTREKGENIRQCIARELMEELGIEVRVGRHLMTVHHAYSHFTIELHVYWGRIIQGRPRPIHCAACTFVRPARLRRYPFSAADLKIVAVLQGHEWVSAPIQMNPAG